MSRIPADDFIDGLPVRRGMEPVDTDSPYIRVRKSLIAPVLGAAITFSCVAGIISSANFDEDYTHQQPAPEVTVTVTTTDTRDAIPESCARAMRLMGELMDANRELLALGPEQLDIMSASHQAITERDWSTLNKLGQKQRDLQGRVASPADTALQGYDKAMKAARECEDATR